MNTLSLVSAVITCVAIAQAPTSKPLASNLADDPALQTALTNAYDSALPHRMLLAATIERIMEEQKIPNPEDFKIGAMAVLRHSDFSSDLKLGELYLRMLQQPVLDDISDSLGAARLITVDGSRKDWPHDSIMVFPKVSKDDKKNKGLLRSFGVLRGQSSLFAYFEIYKRPQSERGKIIYTLQLSKLASRFTKIAYSVNIVDDQVRIFNGAGEEIPAIEDQPVYLKSSARTLELRIPLKRYEEDLRSVAARGFAVESRVKKNPIKSPWVACPTGTVTAPTEMLIHFASKRDLPLHNSLPIAIALQEGLLMASSHADLADEIKKDAYDWFEWALDTAKRMESADLAPPHQWLLSAQLAWACRYHGHQPLNTIEEYRFTVPSPKTIADMRGYATLNGWLATPTPATLRDQVATFMAKEFKPYDYPDQSARELGSEFEDPNPKAYIKKGDEQFLSYRDLGVNQRWTLFEEGFGLKGNQQQAMQIQRALSLALGLPTLWAHYHHQENDSRFTLSYDGGRHKWFAVGAATSNQATKSKVRLLWSKPWTRPERFELWHDQTHRLPEGSTRFLLSGGFESFSPKRFTLLLEKGFEDKLFAKPLLQPLRMR